MVAGVACPSFRLLDVFDGLPPCQSGGEPAASAARGRGLEVASLALGLFATVFGGVSNTVWPTLDRGMVLLAGGLALLSTSALGALGLAVLRRRPDALMMLPGFAIGASLLGPGLAVGGLNVANGWRDATLVEHPALVIKSYTGAAKSNTTYHVVVGPWRPGGPTRDFKVSREHFKAAQASGRVLVRAGRGRLGYEWLRSVEAG